jgi:hypothetical protein
VKQKNRPQEGNALPEDHAQQPPDVVARRTEHRVQPVTLLTLEVTAVHAVIGLEVADDRFDRLWRRLSRFLSCSLIRLDLPRCTMSTSGFCASTPR